MAEEYLDHLEEYLRSSPLDSLEVLDAVLSGAHGGKYKLIFPGGVAAIAKPEDGTDDKRMAVHREEAAWVVARLLGFTAMVACTVQRELNLRGEKVNASVQVLWPDATDDSSLKAADFSKEDVLAAAVFDVIVNHTDHSHNFSAAPEGVQPRHLRLYDNGYAFDFPGRTFDSAFYKELPDEPLTADLVSRIESLIGTAPSSRLPRILERDPYENVIKRAKALAKRRRLFFP